ncbi:hypothetical protein R1flu_013421 [Riccia fluitans]|uniref:Uncharacterized protein n=1 Tax=Riccia fluitans TaxID=41844 RepID=A0ABD1YDY5_9MARC
MLPELHVEDPASMIYTSGPTGEPKGVMVPHRGLLALSMAAAETWELRKAESRMLQFSSHCFDASICEIFPALCSGAVLVLGSRNELLPGHQLAEFIRNQRVTVTLLPPSVMATLNDFSSSLPLLRTIIAGGEACSLALARKWSTLERKFINAYGPTECTVITTMHVFDPTSDDLKTVPLGEPLPGWQTYKHPTPEQLTFCIIQTQKSKAGSKSSNREQEVDAEELLREGLSLDKSLRPIEGLKTSSSVALVTGVTGFLGAFLLENPLLENSFQVIYCLVRGTSPAHAWDRLLATRKKYGLQTKTPVSNIELVMLAGDVQQSKLGLSDEVYSQLSDHVGLIYHVAADTNYIRPYGEMLMFKLD